MNGWTEEPWAPGELPGDEAVEVPPLDGLSWRPSYDRESVEAYAAAVASEQQRLLAEIDAARARVAAVAPPASVEEDDLAALMLAVQDELDALEAEHRRLLAEIRAAADAEAARVLAAAREEVATVRRSASSFSDLLRGARPGGPGRTSMGGGDHLGTPGQADAG